MSLPTISAIAAIGRQRELGAGNDLMWHLPDDFAWFVRHTRGHPVIMGRKTMQSLGKPLKNRQNIVISRQPELLLPDFIHASKLETALEMAAETGTDEIFIIGGGEIYRQSMHLLNRMYLTLVDATFPAADTFYPEWGQEWKEVFREHHPADNKHDYAFDFVILEKS